MILGCITPTFGVCCKNAYNTIMVFTHKKKRERERDDVTERERERGETERERERERKYSQSFSPQHLLTQSPRCQPVSW